MRESYSCGLKTSISKADPGEGPGGPGPLIFGQTEARGAEKHFFLTATLRLSQGLDINRRMKSCPHINKTYLSVKPLPLQSSTSAKC